MNKFFKSRVGQIFMLGLAIKLILSPITYHSDVAPFDFAGYVISHGNVGNFYDFLPNLPQDNPILKVYPANLFNYPPLVYFFLGTCSIIFTFIIDSTFHSQFLFNVQQSFQNPLVFLHLFLLKIPYFMFDIGIFWLFLKIFGNRKEKYLLALLWWLNPINIYASYMMGQFDVLPTFFTVASLYFAAKNNKENTKSMYLAALMLGIGGAFKIYPLFFLVPLMSLVVSWRQRIVIGIIGIFTYLLPIIPFLGSHGFRSTALVANQTLKSLYAQIPVSGGESLQLFTVFMVFLYLLFLLRVTVFENLWKRYLMVLLVFFSFTHYHPQWILWITPFLLIDLGLHKGKSVLLITAVLISWIGAVLLFEQGLNIGLFVPINSALYDGDTIWKILGVSLDVNFFRSVFQSLLVGTGLVYFVRYFPREVKE